MLRLLCFGYPRIEGPEGQLLEAVQNHPKRFSVLIYLACRSGRAAGPYSQRETLLPVFWPEADESHARNCLRQTLHVLRTVLGPDVVQSRNGDGLYVDRTRLSSDVQSFDAAVREGRLQEAMDFVKGDFLADFCVADGGHFMAWADERRRSLKEKAVDAARRLAQEADGARDPYQAIVWWRRALELAPYDERILVNLVWALARSGNRGGAKGAYGTFRARMVRDLELHPSLTTQAAVEKALRSRGASTTSLGDYPSPRQSHWRDTAVGYQAEE